MITTFSPSSTAISTSCFLEKNEATTCILFVCRVLTIYTLTPLLCFSCFKLYWSRKRALRNENKSWVLISLSCELCWVLISYHCEVNPVASFGIKNRKAMGTRVANSCTVMPRRRLSKDSDDMFSTEAKAAPKNEPNVEPRLFMDINRAKSVPSIPGGHSCPEMIKNGIILHVREEGL